jgi:hypothetical protein
MFLCLGSPQKGGVDPIISLTQERIGDERQDQKRGEQDGRRWYTIVVDPDCFGSIVMKILPGMARLSRQDMESAACESRPTPASDTGWAKKNSKA